MELLKKFIGTVETATIEKRLVITMSHTKRIYNKKIRKCHRINLNDNTVKNIKEIDFRNSLWNSIHEYGLVYHPFRQLCMGHCSGCKDHSRDQKHLRKIRARDFRRELECMKWNY